VLLVGAGLLVRSFERLRSVDPGFRTDHLLTFRLSLPDTRYGQPGQIASFYDDLLRRLSALPGVRSAGATSSLPMSRDNTSASFVIEGSPVPEGQAGPHGDWHAVSAGFFTTMGVPLLRGRFIDERDARDAHPVIVIDQVLADRYWPGRDPLGRRISVSGEGTPEAPIWREIVGVVGHLKKYALDGRVKEQYYLPATQAPHGGMFIVLHTSTDPLLSVSAARSAVSALDAGLPIYGVRAMQQVVDDTLIARRFAMMLLALFAAVAMALAGIGLYGVMSYSVSQRTREIGIRMALGAPPAEIVRSVVRRGLILTAVGLGIGAAVALAATRGMSALLFAVPPADPLTYVLMTAILAAVSWLAATLPARRAARVDPMVALRDE